jgi:ribosomal protein S12 methylthiotransferase accessory factor
VALSRALTEAAQSRLTRIAGARDDMAEEKPSADATIARVLLDGLAAEIAGDFGAIAGRDGDDLGDDVRWLLQRLEAAGITRAIAFDLTKPTLGLPVVRVVVPDLESSREHPLYVPGPRARRAAREGA